MKKMNMRKTTVLWMFTIIMIITGCSNHRESFIQIDNKNNETAQFETEYYSADGFMHKNGVDLQFSEVAHEITIRDGYFIEDFGESTGAVYTFSIYRFRNKEDNSLLYWEIIVKQSGVFKDVLLIENDEHGAAFPESEKMVTEMDVNFDGANDILVCLGGFGVQGAVAYKCYLTMNDTFVHCPSFSDIVNPGIDVQRNCIWSSWRNSVISHGVGIFYYEDNEFICTEKLTREYQLLENSSKEYTSHWTDEILVDGEWILREYFTEDEYDDDQLQEKLYSDSAYWNRSDDVKILWKSNYE